MRNISPVAGKKRSFFYWPCYVLFWYHPKIIKPSPIIDFSQTFSHYPQLHSWKPTTSGRTAHRLKPSWRRKSHHSVEAGYIAAKCRDRNLPKIWPRFNFFRMFPRGLSLLGGSVPIKWKKHLQKTSAIVFTDLSTRLVHWTSHFGLVFQKRLLIYLNPAAGVPHGWGPLGWEFSATPIGFKKTPPSLEGAGIKNHWCWFFGWLFLPIFSWWFSFQKSNLRQEFQRSAPLKGLFHDCRQGIAGDQIWQVHDVPGTPPMFQL